MPTSPDGSFTTPRLTTVSLYGSRAPSTRVRIDDWLSHLDVSAQHFRHAGLGNLRPSTVFRHLPEVVAAEITTRRLAHGKRDLLLMSREASPLSHGEVEERFLRSAAHSTYDFDDALFEDGSGLRSIYARPAKCRRGVSTADVVIAGNDYLAGWASQHSRDVRVIPSCIEPSTYLVKGSWAVGEAPVIVWLGSRTTERYVESIAPQLRRLHETTGARLRLISGPGPDSIGLHGFVDRVPWDLRTMPGLLASADIAIAPLDDSPFSRGKCAYKLLQYAAAGLPIVGSPVGANELALKRFDGVAVGPDESWADAIAGVLHEGDDVRRQRGLTGVAAVAEHYSFDAWADEWTRAVGLS
ncbi:glycosyltransferase [Nostocoides sp. HKS02]|nr:glycosyltransferase [Tetrasphaera sp. HKS02]